MKTVTITVEVKDSYWLNDESLESVIQERFEINNETAFSDLGLEIKNVHVAINS